MLLHRTKQRPREWFQAESLTLAAALAADFAAASACQASWTGSLYQLAQQEFARSHGSSWQRSWQSCAAMHGTGFADAMDEGLQTYQQTALPAGPVASLPIFLAP